MSAFSDRRPSYTDRILVSTISENLEILKYSTIDDVKLSDHRPVFADIMLYHQSKNKERPLIIFHINPSFYSRSRIKMFQSKLILNSH
jgi:hypothetical protein